MTKTYPEIVSDLTKIIKLDQARGFDFYINGQALGIFDKHHMYCMISYLISTRH